MASSITATAVTSSNCPNVSTTGTFIGQIVTVVPSAYGRYQGVATNGFAFKPIVLESNEIWTLYGNALSGGGLSVIGMNPS